MLVVATVLIVTHLAGDQVDQQATQRAYQEGTNLGGVPAPAFALQDQTGATVSLDQLRGRPVVSTFFDSVSLRPIERLRLAVSPERS